MATRPRRHAVMRSCGHAVMRSCGHAVMRRRSPIRTATATRFPAEPALRRRPGSGGSDRAPRRVEQLPGPREIPGHHLPIPPRRGELTDGNTFPRRVRSRTMRSSQPQYEVEELSGAAPFPVIPRNQRLRGARSTRGAEAQ
ncbi:hypothetical protein E3E14_20080 [Streptomyces sp. ICN441]|nr:hypothetical protein E3E14_20080 [Streptomyces sp. ICN441]